jgi:hypothetical protein
MSRSRVDVNWWRCSGNGSNGRNVGTRSMNVCAPRFERGDREWFVGVNVAEMAKALRWSVNSDFCC